MIKSIFLAISFVMATLTCFSQSLFFDGPGRSTWVSSPDISEITLRSDKEIPLAKLIYSRDSINKDVTIWTFKDNVLTISRYYFLQKTDTVVGAYKYSVSDKGILQITLKDGVELKYRIGVVSTGYYAVLLRIKEKKRKNKK